MFQKVEQANFLEGEHEMLRFWQEHDVFRKLQQQNAGKPKWSFLDGPITANNPMGVHHAWGRTYKDAYQRYYAMTGHQLRYQNGFDCQGLWVEVEVEKQLNLGTKTAIEEYGIDVFTQECKKRVLNFAARQTEQSVRLGYWMEWDDPDQLRALAAGIGGRDSGIEPKPIKYTTARGQMVTGEAEKIVARLGNPEWGGSYFTFATENNETIWTFLKKCFERKKIYRGHDVMPWSGRGGSAYSQMEVADGRKLTTHRSCFVRFPLLDRENEYLLVWTTTPWTLTSNVAAAVNPDLDYIKIQAKKDGAIYYFAKENLHYKRLEKEFKEGFGRPEWQWPEGTDKLKTIAQIFKEQGGFEELETLKGSEMVGWRYAGPFDDLEAQQTRPYNPSDISYNDSSNPPYPFVGWAQLEWSILDEDDDDFQAKIANRIQWFCNFLYGALDDLLCQRLTEVSEGLQLPQFLDKAKNLGITTVFTTRWATLRKLNSQVYGRKELTDIGASILELLEAGNSVSSSKSKDDPAKLLLSFETLLDELVGTIREEFREYPYFSGVESHRIIDGGRDNKGNANVVAGEGTGIVHIAPGCGDVDHKMGVELGLPVIAPLKEDGTYGEGFGPFTGREAISPETADLVFEELKKKDLLVYVETYPHIYPHCWRTGDELVFRLVDEWFINMDWRDEIKDVTRAINWLPESIQGQEREVEWLTTMRDWMISKKRFWGLALPIWVNPEDPSDFEVIGSLAELKERALDGGEGWDEFEGHTPHRPWIDKVKIKSQTTGAMLERVEDVGNPWLDAGIVPFSTMNYNAWKEAPGSRLQASGGDDFSVQPPEEESLSTLNSHLSTLNWPDWFPADMVTECFPGQFRNWFYSLLALATMMRYDETDDPKEKRPFKNLLGHRLVMDENGNAMHKSDGTAIWFEEAAEQLGVDTLRWMYLAQNPAVDLRFGTRHPDEPVELQTVDGPISQTKEGLPTCKVTSKPADEIRRQVLIPLWNSYAFFVNYAVLDGFDPSLDPVPLPDRPEIDRWVLSRLQELIQTAHDSFQQYRVADFMAASAEFIDDLSNWYIRRNRRRFWRARAEGDTSDNWEQDKLAAYQTLYEVLLTMSKLLAPAVPFLAERMYQNLVRGSGDGGQGKDACPLSVHLCEYPTVDEQKLDADLNWKAKQVQILVRMGHRLRETQDLRVRQPLSELRFACLDPRQGAALEQYRELIADELNVKSVNRAENLDDLVSYSFKPNLKTLGPKYGKLLNVIRNELGNVDQQAMAPLRRGESVTLTMGGQELTFEPEDVMVSVEQASDWASADDAGIQVALSTALTEDLIREGMARDLIRHVQQLRKDANLEENEQITIRWSSEKSDSAFAAIEAWRATVLKETRGTVIESTDHPLAEGKSVNLGDVPILLRIVPASNG